MELRTYRLEIKNRHGETIDSVEVKASCLSSAKRKVPAIPGWFKKVHQAERLSWRELYV